MLSHPQVHLLPRRHIFIRVQIVAYRLITRLYLIALRSTKEILTSQWSRLPAEYRICVCNDDNTCSTRRWKLSISTCRGSAGVESDIASPCRSQLDCHLLAHPVRREPDTLLSCRRAHSPVAALSSALSASALQTLNWLWLPDRLRYPADSGR